MNIQNELQQTYQSAITKYTSHCVLGVFSVGKINYSMVQSSDDIHFVTVYIPTFNQLCYMPDRSDPWVYDIRRAYNCVHDAHEVPLELLFAKYSVVNPRYEKLFREYFLEKREELGRLDQKGRLLKARERMARLVTSDRVEFAKLALSASLYARGATCADCFELNDDLSRNILQNLDSVDDSFFWTMVQNAIEQTDDAVDDDSMVREGIVAIVTEALNRGATYDAFVAELTENEMKALDVLRRVARDGANAINVSISAMCAETGIARSVWKSLLDKMNIMAIARVTSHGVKGTCIEFLSTLE